MLTLLETITAIKALNTDESVIKSACLKLANPEGELDPEDEDEVGKHILRTYSDRGVEASTLLLASIILAGKLAGFSAPPGKEMEVQSHLKGLFNVHFGSSVASKWRELSVTDPAKAELTLKGMLEALRVSLTEKEK